MQCLHCGTTNEEGDLYCVECGQPLLAGIPAAASQRPGTRRLLPWLVLGALVAAGAIGLAAAAYLGLFSLSLPSTGLFARSGEPEAQRHQITATHRPFLIVMQAEDEGMEVVALDLEGQPLATLGSSLVENSVGYPLMDREHPAWPEWQAQPTRGTAAWAWPGSSVAIVALSTGKGSNLVRYDAARGEILGMVQEVQQPAVLGYTDEDRFLVYYSRGGQQNLLAAGQQAEALVRLVQDRQDLHAFRPSPDGNHAVFLANGLFTVSMDGQWVYRQPGEYDTFVFSPNGRDIFYNSGRQLIRANPDGRQARVIAEVGRDGTLTPLSASSSYLAVERNVDDESELLVMAHDGTDVTEIGAGDGLHLAYFLPGDERLLHTQRDGSTWRLDLTDPTNNQTRTVATGLRYAMAYPLHNNRHLALVIERDDGASLILYDLEEDTQVVVEEAVAQVSVLARSPDHLIYASKPGSADGNWSLQALELSSATSRQLDSGASEGYRQVFFLPDEEQILYQVEEQPRPSVVRRADGTSVTTYDVPGGIYRVALDDPQPELIHDQAWLLAASLAR